MRDLVISIAFVVGRYLHLMGMTLLVGGTLFYLWVVPVAIAELKEESKLAVFSRARWVFRWIVFASVITLILTGAIMTARSLSIYEGKQIPIFRDMAKIANPTNPHINTLDHPTIFERPALWFVVHVVLGLICIAISVGLVQGRRPPHWPLQWMRLNFVLLMLVILVASLSRNARTRLFESIEPYARVTQQEVHE